MVENVISLAQPRTGGQPAPPAEDRAVYTVCEVAALLGLARGTAYQLVRQGQIPAEHLGRRWVVPRVRFHAWLDNSPSAGVSKADERRWR